MTRSFDPELKFKAGPMRFCYGLKANATVTTLRYSYKFYLLTVVTTRKRSSKQVDNNNLSLHQIVAIEKN
jgi:hypothetical protein